MYWHNRQWLRRYCHKLKSPSHVVSKWGRKLLKAVKLRALARVTPEPNSPLPVKSQLGVSKAKWELLKSRIRGLEEELLSDRKRSAPRVINIDDLLAWRMGCQEGPRRL
ncbi:MAG TPA: hypothetical protein VGJ20_43375 [Xanthobacteraceae bacterium]